MYSVILSVIRRRTRDVIKSALGLHLTAPTGSYHVQDSREGEAINREVPGHDPSLVISTPPSNSSDAGSLDSSSEEGIYSLLDDILDEFLTINITIITAVGDSALLSDYFQKYALAPQPGKIGYEFEEEVDGGGPVAFLTKLSPIEDHNLGSTQVGAACANQPDEMAFLPMESTSTRHNTEASLPISQRSHGYPTSTVEGGPQARISGCVTLLNNHYQSKGQNGSVRYSVTQQQEENWVCTVTLPDRAQGIVGIGPSKKAAKEAAARQALSVLGEL